MLSLGRLDIDDDEDPYPSLQHVRTSASGLLRFPDDGEGDGDDDDDFLLSFSSNQFSDDNRQKVSLNSW